MWKQNFPLLGFRSGPTPQVRIFCGPPTHVPGSSTPVVIRPRNFLDSWVLCQCPALWMPNPSLYDSSISLNLPPITPPLHTAPTIIKGKSQHSLTLPAHHISVNRLDSSSQIWPTNYHPISSKVVEQTKTNALYKLVPSEPSQAFHWKNCWTLLWWMEPVTSAKFSLIPFFKISELWSKGWWGLFAIRSK